MEEIPKVPNVPDINDINKPDLPTNNDAKPAAYNPFYNTMDSMKSSLGSVTSSLGSISSIQNINTEDVKSVFSNKIYIGLIIVIVVSVVIAYLLYLYITKSIFNQSKVLIEGTKRPIVCNKLTKIPIKEFNKSGNGKRRTFTFWIYIHDLNKYKGSYKHVFHIGESGEIKNASPYIFLDKNENKLYVRFAAIDDDSMGTDNRSSVQNMSDDVLSTFMKQGIVIPYIPIQRWVHIAIVVNENSNGGNIIAYVDGDISKIATTGDISQGSNLKISNLNLDKMGDLYAGGSFESASGPGFSGLISKVTMYNYDLNNKDIYDDYNKGPLDGLLASLGITNYGLRSPIYKIE